MAVERNTIMEVGGRYLTQDLNHMSDIRPEADEIQHAPARHVVRTSARQPQSKRMHLATSRVGRHATAMA